MSLRNLVLVAPMFVAGCATTAPSTTEAESAIRAATHHWATAFNTCKEPVASLYDAGALLWGTVSTSLLSEQEPVVQYFASTCGPMPKPTVELGQFVVRSYGDTGISAGVYTFTVFPGGQQRSAPARFAFTFRRSGEKWLIVSHHSSLLPTSPAPPAQPRQ